MDLPPEFAVLTMRRARATLLKRAWDRSYSVCNVLDKVRWHLIESQPACSVRFLQRLRTVLDEADEKADILRDMIGQGGCCPGAVFGPFIMTC